MTYRTLQFAATVSLMVTMTAFAQMPTPQQRTAPCQLSRQPFEPGRGDGAERKLPRVATTCDGKRPA